MTSQNAAFEGRIVSVSVEEAELPDGQRLPLEVVRHPGGAAVVAIDTARRVCLLRQYRHVARDWLWELPAGKLGDEPTPCDTARAELAEEAGLTARRWDSLGVIRTSPGVFSEVVHLYLARDLAPTARRLEAGELIEVHWWDLDDAVAGALGGEISDAKTAIGVLRAAAIHDERNLPWRT
jgi:ADP-ribose pyrophosphatase